MVKIIVFDIARLAGQDIRDGHEHRHAGHTEVVIIAVLRRVAPAVEGFEGEEIPDPLVIYRVLCRVFSDTLRLIEREAHTEHHRERQRKSDQSFHAAPSPQLTLMLIEQSFPS